MRGLAVLLVAALGESSVWAQDGGPPDAGAPPPSAVADDPARVLTQGRGVRVTAGHVADEINARPPALRGNFADPAAVDALVRDLARRQLLSAEARRRGALDDPEVQRRLEAILAEELLRRELAAVESQRVTRAEIEAYYQAHLADFTKPDRVRVSVVVVRDQALGRRVVAWARNTSERRFLLLVRRNSMQRTRWPPGSDVGSILRTGSRVDPAIVAAAFRLQTPGQIADEPVQAADGRWYVLRFEERLPTETTPLANVRSAVESRIRADRRAAAIEALVGRLSREAGVRTTPARRSVRVINLPPPEPEETPAAPEEGVHPPAPSD
jgi:hypothetical protein